LADPSELGVTFNASLGCKEIKGEKNHVRSDLGEVAVNKNAVPISTDPPRVTCGSDLLPLGLTQLTEVQPDWNSLSASGVSNTRYFFRLSD
jgi:hypothetical protein